MNETRIKSGLTINKVRNKLRLTLNELRISVNEVRIKLGLV